MGAWLLLSVISLSWAEQRGAAVTELRALVLEPAVFYLILRASLRERIMLVRLIDALLIAGCVVAVIGLFQYANGEATITAEGGVRRLARSTDRPTTLACSSDAAFHSCWLLYSSGGCAAASSRWSQPDILVLAAVHSGSGWRALLGIRFRQRCPAPGLRATGADRVSMTNPRRDCRFHAGAPFCTFCPRPRFFGRNQLFPPACLAKHAGR